VKKNSFGLLELEMADLERFWRKTPLGPLAVKLLKLVLHSLDKMTLNNVYSGVSITPKLHSLQIPKCPILLFGNNLQLFG
jgi:hypothetical protein